MTNRYELTTYETGKEDHRETCEKDRLGRLIGAQVRLISATVRNLAEGEKAEGWRAYHGEGWPDGPIFGFRTHATRNGSLYGASQRDRFFQPEAERDAEIEKYFAGFAKRTAKKAAAK